MLPKLHESNTKLGTKPNLLYKYDIITGKSHEIVKLLFEVAFGIPLTENKYR